MRLSKTVSRKRSLWKMKSRKKGIKGIFRWPWKTPRIMTGVRVCKSKSKPDVSRVLKTVDSGSRLGFWKSNAISKTGRIWIQNLPLSFYNIRIIIILIVIIPAFKSCVKIKWINIVSVSGSIRISHQPFSPLTWSLFCPAIGWNACFYFFY